MSLELLFCKQQMQLHAVMEDIEAGFCRHNVLVFCSWCYVNKSVFIPAGPRAEEEVAVLTRRRRKKSKCNDVSYCWHLNTLVLAASCN